MANKSVFASMKGRLLPKATTTNAHAAPAYSYCDAHHLAQVAVTGTFAGLHYQSAEEQLEYVIDLAESVDVLTLAQTAIYARETAHMKDMPAVLLAALARRDPVLFRAVFGRVVDIGKMLRTFVQVIRSGQTGRKSLGSAPKAMVQNWLNNASDWALLNANIGNDPSLADVIKMVHPKAETAERDALFAWIVGRPCEYALLPKAVQEWMVFNKTGKGPLPDVPFQMLTQLKLTPKHWARIAKNGSWQMVRQNLNTFQRHGVFEVKREVKRIAALLCDPKRIEKAKAFPYQLMVARQHLADGMPQEIIDALHDAMEIAVNNVPMVDGAVAVGVDVSGSMTCPVTGVRTGATSKVRFVDVAALVGASFLRRNPKTTVLPFDFVVRDTRLEPRDTILTNAARLAELAGGGTDCSAPLEWLNTRGRAPDLVVLVSDNQSWIDARRGGNATHTMYQWEVLKRRNPKAKLVCIDIAPYGTTQAKEREDILNVGGFSDAVFDQIASFAAGNYGPRHWVGEIEKIEI